MYNMDMNTYNVSDVATILFNLDPMGTSCVQNGIFQEYQAEANIIEGQLNSYFTVNLEDIKNLIVQVFNYYFWDNCLSQQQIEEIANEIYNLSRVH